MKNMSNHPSSMEFEPVKIDDLLRRGDRVIAPLLQLSSPDELETCQLNAMIDIASNHIRRWQVLHIVDDRERTYAYNTLEAALEKYNTIMRTMWYTGDIAIQQKICK